MNGLYASTIKKLIEQGRISSGMELLSCIGPETNLDLLLKMLYEMKPYLATREMLYHLLCHTCFYCPEVAEKYLSEIKREEVLSDYGIFLHFGCFYLEIYKQYKENNYKNSSLFNEAFKKVFGRVIENIYLPKFRSFLKGKGKTLLISLGYLRNFEELLKNENLLVDVDTQDTSTLQDYFFHKVISKTDIPIRVYKTNIDIKFFKKWFDDFKTIKTIILTSRREPNYNRNSNGYPIFYLRLHFKPNKVIQYDAEKDHLKLYYGVKTVIATIRVEYEENKYVPKLDNIDIDIERRTLDPRCLVNKVGEVEYSNIYAEKIRKFLRDLVERNKEVLQAPAPNFIFLDEPLFNLVMKNKEE